MTKMKLSVQSMAAKKMSKRKCEEISKYCRRNGDIINRLYSLAISQSIDGTARRRMKAKARREGGGGGV